MNISKIIFNLKKTLEKNEILKIKKILFLMFFALLLETLSITSLVPLIGFIAAPDVFINKIEEFNILNGALTNFLANEDKYKILLYLSFFTVLIFGFKNLSIILIQRYKEKVFAKLSVNLSSRIYSSYLNCDYQFFLENNSAKVVRNLVTEVPNVINLLNTIFLIIIDLGLIILLSALIIFINFKIYLSVLFFLILFGTLYIKYFKKTLALAGSQRQFFQAKFIKNINETFSLFNYIKIEKLADFFYNMFTHSALKFNQANLKKSIILLYTRNILEFCLIVFLVISLLYLVILYQDFEKVQVLLAVILLIVIRLSPTFLRVINSINNIRFIIISLSEINKIKILLKDKKFKKVNQYNLKLNNIKFKNVKFKFNGEKKYIFEKLQLNLSSNDKVCIIGETGSGKSTLLNLLLGLIKPSSGKIFINNKNIALYKLNNIVSYVPQKIILFEDTIKKNILFNKNEKNFDTKKFQRCINDVNLTSFLNSKKNKENFLLSEDGKNISVGQKQRIGLARAIFDQTDLLVLDEATSSLDEKNENIIYKNLIKRFKNKMIICVTHRLSNLKYFDKVFKVEKSKLIKIK